MTSQLRKSYYGQGKQAWDTILFLGWGPQFAAGNILKYLRRTKEPEHSLLSARWYFQELKFMCDEQRATGQGNAIAVYNVLLFELSKEELLSLERAQTLLEE